MKHVSRLTLALTLAIGTSLVLAQAPVTDIGTQQRRAAAPASSDAIESGYPAQTYPTTPAPSIERSNDYPSEAPPVAIEKGPLENGPRSQQQLREEISTLRGELEELRHTVHKLQQQHDQDMITLSGGSATATTTAPAATSGAPTTAAPATGNMTSEGKAEYESAYGKLKAKDHEGAITGFKSIIETHPNSEYAGNSHFWLGFIYQTKGNTEGAMKSFNTLIDKFPGHNKSSDAKYNLGKLYHQQGDTTKSKALLTDVASGTSKSAPLAKSYLESMQ